MAMRLTGASIGTAIEKPQSSGCCIDQGEGTPIVKGQPTGLGLPGLGYQQHVGGLNRIFVQNHHVRIADPFHLQPLIPGEKRIWLGACGSQVFWCCAKEMAQLKAGASLSHQVR